MPRTARKRYLRHDNFDRTNRSRHLRAFLAARATDLEDTGTAYTFTIAAADPPANTVVLGADEEADRDALLLLLGGNAALASSSDASTNVINLVFNDSPAVLSANSDALTAFVATSITFAGTGDDGDTITVGAVTYTLRTSAVEPTDIEIGGTAAATVTAAAAVIDGNAAISLVDATDEILSINFAVSPAIIEVTGADLTLVIGAGILFNEQPAPDDTITVGAVTYTFTDVDPGYQEILTTSAPHGLAIGEGPFFVNSTTDIPENMVGVLFWVKSAPETDELVLGTQRGSDMETFFPSDAGVGTLTLVKADTQPAIYEYLRQNPIEVVRDADDVDDL